MEHQWIDVWPYVGPACSVGMALIHGSACVGGQGLCECVCVYASVASCQTKRKIQSRIDQHAILVEGRYFLNAFDA